MLIFKDMFCDAEVLSDAFNIVDGLTGAAVVFEGKRHEQIESAILKVPSRKVVPNESGEVDIGCGNSFGGSNEDEDAGGDVNPDAPQPVIDIVHYFELQPVSITKAVWKKYFMGWAKELKERITAYDANNGTKLSEVFKKNFPALKTFGLTTVYDDLENYELY